MTQFRSRADFGSYIRTNSYSTERLGAVVGRALVVLFKRQTAAEQAQNNAVNTNNIGFSKGDSKCGCITAKYYIKNKKLEDWMIERWLNCNERGEMRITKYWRQISEAIQEKASQNS